MLACAGCVDQERQVGGIPVQPRPVEPSVQADAVAKSINALTFQLIQRTGTPSDQNVLISPYSISTALSTVVPGALAQDRLTLLGVLAPRTPEDAVMTGSRDLSHLMMSAAGEPLKIANSVWSFRSMDVNPSYIQDLKNYFSADVRQFDRNPSSVNDINAWVDEKTKHRIPSIIQQIKPSDRLFLINAIAFDGTWVMQFDPKETTTSEFHSPAGDVQAPIMHVKGEVPYFKDAELRAVKLNYEGGDFSMLLMLPEHGKDAGALLRALSAERVSAVVNGLSNINQVLVALPKFKFSDEYQLKQPLSDMGMQSLFEHANLGGISKELEENGFIDEVIHKTFIEVDEKGTKAAAATAVRIGITSVQLDPPQFIADRPFAFLILHNPTKAIIFAGVVNDPTKD
ncbi:MAG: hypothetical protein QOJ65_2819 [Fimbriimonadaceae bacterium]|jgi:serpin B|nr:hypothetical protein [Fimbriimonadaceae bacterium]